MYNLAEIATSGINMNYEGNGISAPFSSAGMFNLSANVAGTPVELKKGNDIKIDFKSNDSTQSYNYYVYDSVKRTWKEFGNDSVKKIRVAKTNDSSNIIKDNRISLVNAFVPQPRIYYTNHPIHILWHIDKNKSSNGNFDISASTYKFKEMVDTSKRDNYFYEIDALKKTSWMLVSSHTRKSIKSFSFNNKLMTSEVEPRKWKRKPRYIKSEISADKYVEFDVIADKETDDFIFRFYDAVDTVEFHAYPLISNRSTERTQKAIKKLYFTYDAKSNERKVITKYRKLKFENAYKNFKTIASNTRNSNFVYQEKNLNELFEEPVSRNTYDVTRMLVLQGFGTYNCDRPINFENPIVFDANFINEKGKKIESSDVKLIDSRLNISQTLSTGAKITVLSGKKLTILGNLIQ